MPLGSLGDLKLMAICYLSGLIKRNETKTIEGIQWRRSDALGAVRSSEYSTCRISHAVHIST